MSAHDLTEKCARTAALRLREELGERLLIDVEAALHIRGAVERPTQYLDPISLGSLIVSVASLGWTIFADLRKRTTRPSKEIIARRIRVELSPADETSHAQRDRIIDVVVDAIMESAEQQSHNEADAIDILEDDRKG